jgi:hypothetical protein
VCVPLYMSVSVSVSVCLAVRPSVCLSVSLSVCLPVCLSVYLSVSQSVSQSGSLVCLLPLCIDGWNHWILARKHASTKILSAMSLRQQYPARTRFTSDGAPWRSKAGMARDPTALAAWAQRRSEGYPSSGCATTTSPTSLFLVGVGCACV